jgi:FtsZ-binding cell division protein ZapB|tara:strand:- start:34 stop:315 length:282 start_codon:yes stop_codon:yes gene_type:complete
MAKNKEVVDLKPQNITKEELEGLQNLVNTLNRLQIEIGSLESRKHGLLHQVTQLQGQMQTMQKTFEDTYGKVDINITDGAISYPEDVEVNKED